MADNTSAFLIELPDLAATRRLGRSLGQLLQPRCVVALIGELGAGKTQLARAIAEGLNIADSRIVTSPTFVLVQEYAARLPIYHFDAYRLKSENEFAELGTDEYFDSDGVCLIEWADRVADCLPVEQIRISLTVLGENARQARIEGRGKIFDKWIAELSKNNSPV